MVAALLFLSLLAPLPDPPALQALPLQAPLAVDGRLDERDWQTAPVATDFLQARPVEGASPSQETEVRVLYGDDALYVGARMYDTQPSSIQRTLGRRDDFNQADWFTVAIDGYLDRKTALLFAVSAAGVQADGTLAGTSEDLSWDAIWSSAVQVDSLGWTAELRIPYSMLRFSSAEVQRWGINFRRLIPRTAETVEWSLVRRADRGRGTVAGFGTLEGLAGIEPRRNIQLTPYVLASARVDDARRTLPEAGYEYDLGADLKVGLAPNVTLDLTVNPDFGQVESDPATLNLSAFETVFEERRPFFVEGQEAFRVDAGEDRVLYTRRIGADAPIIGAAKLTGRTAGGLSFGVLGATTGDAFSPERVYGAARARQTLGRDSRVGLATTVLDATPGGAGRRRAFASIADWDVRFLGNTHALSGYAGLSHRRPDDGAYATGVAAGAEVARLSGTWQWRFGGSLTDPRYDLNDVGRMRRNDLFRFTGGTSYDLNGGQPFGLFQRARVSLRGGNSFTYRERRNLGLGVFFSADVLTNAYQEIEVDVFTDYLFGGYDPYETRGLAPRAQPREMRLSVSFETDARRTWSLEPRASVQLWEDQGREVEARLEARLQLSSSIEVGADVEIGREDGRVAWVANETLRQSDGGWQIGARSRPPAGLGETDYVAFDAPTLALLLDGVAPYGAPGLYFLPLFGARDGRTFDASVRTTATFTPNLSLQLYGQLFAARGRYRSFRLMTSPDALPGFADYPKRQAYQVATFQLNTVLRWQYRPGSRLFVVWTQARNRDLRQDPFGYDDPLLFDVTTGRQIADAFGLFPDNVFVVKLTYTLLR